MALVVASNMAALNTYNTLKKNDKKMANNLEKVSSGMKINSAKDDASGYAISEKMRVRIRALEQDDQNVKNGKSLLFVAHGGIQEIVNNLRTIKEMALNAANDTNTDEDRAIIQKELEQRKLQIDDIASTTEFNGKYLLNGSLKSIYKSSSISSSETYNNYVIPSVNKGKILPVIDTNNPNEYSYTITEDGIYGIQYPGNMNDELKNCTIYIDADNVTLKDWNWAQVPHLNMKIVCLRDNTNIVLDNTCISTWGTDSLITFGSGTQNTLTCIPGYNYLTRSPDEGSVINTPMIDIGGGLTILTHGRESNVSPDLILREENRKKGIIKNTITYNSPLIGTKANVQTDSNLTIKTENYPVEDYRGIQNRFSILIFSDQLKDYCNVCVIGSGANGSMGDINQISGTISYQYNDYGLNHDFSHWFPELYGAGKGGTVGNIYYNHIYSTSYTNNSNYRYSYPVTYSNDETSDDEHLNIDNLYRDKDDGLVIHTGTKANENIHINIDDMHCKALGIGNIKVVNRDEATNSLSYIDAAIDKALGEITDVGAYISRLDFTDNNIITAQENTMSAESVIRDADMAKEMTDYSKHNVLLQAAQSMLAQANQNSSMVLSLLQ